MSDVVLSAGVRQNLLSLQKTAELMGTTQNRLATGKKVNSALDNPSNFFTSVSLQARAGDLSALLDAMSNGIKTLEASDNGLKAITRTVESIQSTIRQARQDKSQSVTPGANTFTGTNTSTATNNQIGFDLGNGVSVAIPTFNSVNATVSTLTSTVGTYTTDLSANGFTIDDDGAGAHAPVSITLQAGSLTLAAKVADINADLSAAGSTIVASVDAGKIKLTNASGEPIVVAEGAGTTATTLGFAVGNRNSTDGTPAVSVALTETELATAINSNSGLSGKVRASVDATGNLRLENLTTSAISITGATATDITGDASAPPYSLAAGTASTVSNVRQNLANQFTDLKAEIARLADDAGFNGVNLLSGDKLKLSFNETGSSFIEVQGKKADGTPFGALTASSLGLDGTYDFSDDADLETLLTAVSSALITLRTQASQYGTNLTSVQNRQDFTKAMINTLQTGADNLVLADTNEEGANMLALQTRQQLSTTALSLSSQADQAVLRLFG
jgi:flagellin-like hook-associated protein FlgL